VQLGIDDETTGYIDTTGNWVVPPQYSYGWPFAGGLAWVNYTSPVSSTTQYGYIDRTGKRVAWQIIGQ
jgi:WG containing repeat